MITQLEIDTDVYPCYPNLSSIWGLLNMEGAQVQISKLEGRPARGHVSSFILGLVTILMAAPTVTNASTAVAAPLKQNQTFVGEDHALCVTEADRYYEDKGVYRRHYLVLHNSCDLAFSLQIEKPNWGKPTESQKAVIQGRNKDGTHSEYRTYCLQGLSKKTPKEEGCRGIISWTVLGIAKGYSRSAKPTDQ